MNKKNYIVINNVCHIICNNKKNYNNCDICSLKDYCKLLCYNNPNFCLAKWLFYKTDVHFEIKKNNFNKVKKYAKQNALIYGTCFADVSSSVANDRENGFYDGFINCYKSDLI